MKKDELSAAIQGSRIQMLKAIEGMDEKAMLAPGACGEWSVRDLLAHMARWEGELVRMLFQLKQGQTPTYPSLGEPNVDKINARFYSESLGRPLDLILADFQSVRKQTLRRINDFSENELNDPNAYPALKGRALIEYIAGDTYEHEAEHSAQIREWRNRKDQQTKEE